MWHHQSFPIQHVERLWLLSTARKQQLSYQQFIVSIATFSSSSCRPLYVNQAVPSSIFPSLKGA
jgi:hypothetical protein